MANEIAVGENAEKLAFFIRNNRSSGADFGHCFQHVADRRVGRDHGERVPRPHDLVNAQKQTAPDHSGRMEAGEIFFLKAARFEEHHRKRVTEGEHDGRARSRREIKRTSFLFDVHVENDVRIPGEVRTRIATNRDDLDLEPRDGRQYAQQFLRFAASAEGENHITVRDHPEIAMQRIKRIEHHRGRTGAA